MSIDLITLILVINLFIAISTSIEYSSHSSMSIVPIILYSLSPVVPVPINQLLCQIYHSILINTIHYILIIIHYIPITIIIDSILITIDSILLPISLFLYSSIF